MVPPFLTSLGDSRRHALSRPYFTRRRGELSVVALLTLMLPVMGSSQSPARAGINYDESKVGAYTLPDPLVRSNGAAVRTAEEWRRGRRPELLALFEREVYGK